jgi:S-DNA-T family DNA segregation ATPase FtsK/SpoIIIE
VLWSIIRALGGGVRAGLVQLWVIDPKGGMELAFGAPLFHRFCYGDDRTTDPDTKRAFETTFAGFLEELVAEMRRRQSYLRGRYRLHRPSPGDPVIVVLIDELASLTAYVIDRDAKKRIAVALQLLLSQGRAVGVLVVAAVQDPRKDVVPDRGLFPTRIALRLNEEEDTDLVLGKAARRRGAACHEIPENTPGVGYVVLDGVREPARVRAGHVTDNDIAAMVTHPAAPGQAADVVQQFPLLGDGDELGRAA